MTDTSPDTTYAFLCGADMDPLVIRRRDGLAAARFIAIGATDHPAAIATLPGDPGPGEIWGIILRVPATAVPEGAPMIPVDQRDGTRIRAALLTTPRTAGDAEAILAQARYWELPVPYRARVEALLVHQTA